MANISRTPSDLTSILDEQLGFLKRSCDAFDDGFKDEIKRLATSVRVLVHDTAKSTSLLTLTSKKGSRFLDTADPYDDENCLSHSSLVQMHVTKKGNKPKAHLEDVLTSNLLGFDDWWNGIVFVDNARNEFSRKDITLHLANKDGGAHVDHEIDEIYHNLRNNNSLGWISVLGDGRQIAGEDQVPATMRQIAHELIKSLDSTYSCPRSIDPNTLMVVRGQSLIVGPTPSEIGLPNLRKDRPIVDGKKVGRNDLCSCGSGKKYKKCCLTL